MIGYGSRVVFFESRKNSKSRESRIFDSRKVIKFQKFQEFSKKFLKRKKLLKIKQKEDLRNVDKKRKNYYKSKIFKIFY